MNDSMNIVLYNALFDKEDKDLKSCCSKGLRDCLSTLPLQDKFMIFIILPLTINRETLCKKSTRN